MSLARALARWIDSRLGVADFARRSAKKAFPDHWSFLLGEMALYSFVILVLTGIFLTFFFKPSMTDEIYQGNFVRLDGVHMSEAYASTLRISFDIRGGLLIRQIHHWAALIFVGAIALHAMRMFFTGAFRRPRELNWMIGTVMFALAAMEGFAGYSLPDDLLSGTGVRIAQGIMMSIPVVGTYITYFAFGGHYPGHDFIPRLYIAHVLLIPGLLIALISAHLLILWHQEHTQWPGKKQREDNVVGEPLFPIFLVKTQALLLFTLAATVLLATFAQINPIWLYGPYNPAMVSTGSQPDWYIGFLEGALRLMPSWTTELPGHTIAWNVFLPAVVLPAVFFLLMAAYPAIEQFVTGDTRHHHLLDRPRNAPTRTALGVGVLAMAVDIQFAGADDVLSEHFGIPLFTLVWILRVGFLAAPFLAFILARYACLALQQRDERRLAIGRQTGVVEMAPGGYYREVTRPLPEERQALLSTQRADRLVAPIPRHVVPLPTPRRIGAQVRARLNHFFTRYQVESPNGGQGQGREETPALSSRHEARGDGG
jgi:ubiquinol-cytochrome c reductase cytochrome b subunit